MLESLKMFVFVHSETFFEFFDLVYLLLFYLNYLLSLTLTFVLSFSSSLLKMLFLTQFCRQINSKY